MKGKRIALLSGLEGKIGKDQYFRRHPNPDLVIIQNKPDRSRKKGAPINADLKRTNDALLAAKERAKAIYHDPEQRAAKAAEFAELDAKCKKKGNRHIDGGKELGGYELPYSLWPWIYGECLRSAHKALKENENGTGIG